MKLIKRIFAAMDQSWCNKCKRVYSDAEIWRSNRKCPGCGAQDWSDC